MPSEALLELRKFVAPEFVFGPGALALAGRYARNLGARRPLLVTDPGVRAAGWTDRVLDSIREHGLAAVVFDRVTPNPRDHEVMAGAEVYRAEGCDAIVAVGGGSPMDCAKGIGIVCSNDRHVLSFEGVDNVPTPGPPLICVPTTAGSSADVSQFAIINDTGRKVKIAIVSKTMVPDVSLIDPAATATMDRDLTAHTGLDALTHAVEGYVSNAHSPVSDLFALEAVRRIAANLPRALEAPGDLAARSGMMLGSMYAGLAFSNAILGAVHAMAHSLGGLKDLPHGQCNAILLDHVADFNFAAAPDRYAAVARALGGEVPEDASLEERKAATLGVLRDFKRRAGVTVGLAELGVTRQELAALAEFAMADPCMATNPLEPCCEDIVTIYERAL
ncbi:MAG: alcohol dehydrogenase-like regulatory protein ErcA [Thermodesulfobacteriota bacterium]